MAACSEWRDENNLLLNDMDPKEPLSVRGSSAYRKVNYYAHMKFINQHAAHDLRHNCSLRARQLVLSLTRKDVDVINVGRRSEPSHDKALKGRSGVHRAIFRPMSETNTVRTLRVRMRGSTGAHRRVGWCVARPVVASPASAGAPLVERARRTRLLSTVVTRHTRGGYVSSLCRVDNLYLLYAPLDQLRVSDARGPGVYTTVVTRHTRGGCASLTRVVQVLTRRTTRFLIGSAYIINDGPRDDYTTAR
jgi:hypothetical protein